MPTALPFPSPWSSRILPADIPRAARRGGPALTAAVAAIVAIAAERARDGGEFAALRDAIERALDSGGPPTPDHDDSAGLPHIADADPMREAPRLRALMARLQPG